MGLSGFADFPHMSSAWSSASTFKHTEQHGSVDDCCEGDDELYDVRVMIICDNNSVPIMGHWSVAVELCGKMMCEMQLMNNQGTSEAHFAKHASIDFKKARVVPING